MPSIREALGLVILLTILLAGCTGTPAPTDPAAPAPLLISTEPLWGISGVPQHRVVFTEGLAVLHDAQQLSVRDAQTGELRWRMGFDSELIGGAGEKLLSTPPTVVGTGTDAVVITRFYSLGDARGNYVKKLGYAGLLALSLADGHLVWRADGLQTPVDGNWNNSVELVAANEQVALMQVDGPDPDDSTITGHRLLAIRSSDGTRLWSVPGVRGEYLADQVIGVTLTGDDDPPQDSAPTGSGVAILDAATGTARWRHEATDTRVSAGNSHALALASGQTADSLQLTMLSAADGRQIDIPETDPTDCRAASELLACGGGESLLLVDRELRVRTTGIGIGDHLVDVQRDLAFLGTPADVAPTRVIDAAARVIPTNLPGQVLGIGEGYLAVGMGDPSGSAPQSDVLIYRQVAGEPGQTPSPGAQTPTGFPTPTDPTDYRPPRPAPLAEPVRLGQRLWQATAPHETTAAFHGDSLVVMGQSASAQDPAELVVLDVHTGQARWSLHAGDLLPGGSGQYLWWQPGQPGQRFFLIVDAGQPLVLVSYRMNSCASAAADCPHDQGYTTGMGIAALSLADGRLVWQYAGAERAEAGASDDKRFWSQGMSLLTGAASGVVLTTTSAEYYAPNPSSDELTALDAATGRVLWSKPGVLGKVVTDDVVHVSRGQGDRYDDHSITDTIAYDLHTGEQRWRIASPGRWPVAADAEHVLLAEWTTGGAGTMEVRSAADGELVVDLGEGHWGCGTFTEVMACSSTAGLKIIPSRGTQWLLNTPDEYPADSLDAIQGERYFVSSPNRENAGAATSLMVDANGTPLGEPLPGRVLAMAEDVIVLLDDQQVTLYRYQS